MNAHKHVVYADRTGRAFFNPAPIHSSVSIGEIVNDHEVVLIGSIAECEAEVLRRNAGAPAVTFADILSSASAPK